MDSVKPIVATAFTLTLDTYKISTIAKIDSSFIISFEDIQNLLGYFRNIIDDSKLKELEENFDKLLYENVKESLNTIKANINQKANYE